MNEAAAPRRRGVLLRELVTLWVGLPLMAQALGAAAGGLTFALGASPGTALVMALAGAFLGGAIAFERGSRPGWPLAPWSRFVPVAAFLLLLAISSATGVGYGARELDGWRALLHIVVLLVFLPWGGLALAAVWAGPEFGRIMLAVPALAHGGYALFLWWGSLHGNPGSGGLGIRGARRPADLRRPDQRGPG